MKPTLVERPEFQDEVKRLSRKYRHIENDLQDFYKEFLPAPLVWAFAILALNVGCGRSGRKALISSEERAAGFG